MVLYAPFPLIWYATWPCSKKVEFWLSLLNTMETWTIHKRRIYSHYSQISSACYFFQVAFWVITVNWHKHNFSVMMCLSSQIDSLSIAPVQTIGDFFCLARRKSVVVCNRQALNWFRSCGGESASHFIGTSHVTGLPDRLTTGIYRAHRISTKVWKRRNMFAP